MSIPLTKLTSSKQKHKNALYFTQTDYLQLVDWLGRAILPNKRGAIEIETSPILERLNLQREAFIALMKNKDDLSGLSAIGSPSVLTHYAEKLGIQRARGKALTQKLFN